MQSVEPARLFDVQRRGVRSGEWLGANVRIVKGLSLRMGKFDSQQTRLPVETVPVDSGQLYRTSQRIVFLGATNLVEIETRNIISTDQSDGRLTVYVRRSSEPVHLRAPAHPRDSSSPGLIGAPSEIGTSRPRVC